MIRASIAAAALALLAGAGPGFAGQYDYDDDAAPNTSAPAPGLDGANNKLMIVNGYNGRVIFDDHHDDQFCVIRRYIVGYHWDGRPIIRRGMNCR